MFGFEESWEEVQLRGGTSKNCVCRFLPERSNLDNFLSHIQRKVGDMTTVGGWSDWEQQRQKQNGSFDGSDPVFVATNHECLGRYHLFDHRNQIIVSHCPTPS